MPKPTKEKPLRSWWPARQISGRGMSIPCCFHAAPPTVISATCWSGSLRRLALTSIPGQPSAAGTTSVNYRKPACRRYHCAKTGSIISRSEEHTSELQSRLHLVCRLLLEKKKKKKKKNAVMNFNKITSNYI